VRDRCGPFLKREPGPETLIEGRRRKNSRRKPRHPEAANRNKTLCTPLSGLGLFYARLREKKPEPYYLEKGKTEGWLTEKKRKNISSR